jgi:hypothetical protein
MRPSSCLFALSTLLVGCASDWSVQDLRQPEDGDDAVEWQNAETDADGPAGDDQDEGGGGGGDISFEDADGDDPAEDPGEDPTEDPTEDPAPEDDCEATSELIYLIDRDTETLSLFDPDSLQVTALGTLDCSWYDGTPASMAVARDGVAYVRYSSNVVFEVDLLTLDCQEMAYDNRVTGFGSFGMGFATDSAGTWRERLFVANASRVARLDTGTWQVTSLGTLPSQAELTGTADGELWAFLPLESPAALVELDKDSGAILSRTNLGSFPNPGDIDTFAFAAWGGAHYLFVRVYGMGESTDVYEVLADGSMTRIVRRMGLNVVGAGVSTCAPTE